MGNTQGKEPPADGAGLGLSGELVSGSTWRAIGWDDEVPPADLRRDGARWVMFNDLFRISPLPALV